MSIALTCKLSCAPCTLYMSGARSVLGVRGAVLHPYVMALPACRLWRWVKNRLSQEDAQQTGWLLDGYPRSADQAEAIEEASIRPDVFILIDVSSDPCAIPCMHVWCSSRHLCMSYSRVSGSSASPLH